MDECSTDESSPRDRFCGDSAGSPVGPSSAGKPASSRILLIRVPTLSQPMGVSCAAVLKVGIDGDVGGMIFVEVTGVEDEAGVGEGAVGGDALGAAGAS